MPPNMKKKSQSNNKKIDGPYQSAPEVICYDHAPGPKYKLKSVLGYDDHCPSMHRNPAYSFAKKSRNEIKDIHSSPGPIYLPTFPQTTGFSMGLPIKYTKTREFTPGPYFIPETSHGPSFSMSWRIPEKIAHKSSPGPYNLPRYLNGPSFTIGTRLKIREIDHGIPSPRLTNVDMITQRAPAFSLQFKRHNHNTMNVTPGYYDPVELDKGPAFSFGVKHHPCTSPYITQCDKII